MTFDWISQRQRDIDAVKAQQTRQATERADAQRWWAEQPDRIATRLGLEEAS